MTPESSSRPASASLRIESITDEVHHGFLAARPASFLQNPRWPQVKTDWRGESLGWFDSEELVAVSVVLHRHLPVPLLKSRSLAYLADGPVFDPARVELGAILAPLAPYLQRQGAFMIRMGLPVVHRRWDSQEVRRALAAGEHQLITDLEPLEVNEQAEAMRRTLLDAGWVEPSAGEDFAAGQPPFQARIPLPEQPEPRPEPGAVVSEDPAEFTTVVDEVLGRMDQSSRRQTRKSTRTELTVREGGLEDLGVWQRLYQETAERDGFTGRPQSYFERMYRELNDSPTAECRLLLAYLEDQPLAAAIYVRQGDTGWYVYGASSSEERKRYAPRALQLEQLRRSLAAGDRWYDLGGVSATLNPEHELAGLTRFKTTMGADVVQTLGEWDLPLNKVLTRAFNLYMARRD
ncbi:lipid II:glycine glycyltransferase FemX [Citricoccus sp. NR2]|uniref:lipid II:glycine glycyltransferase FemX n=1 Tax=Citricoccus sp. NR2 TaxID=3004095 RepID=UPI0022DE8AEC|nr:peptidoglycan bridge formation glycyltransferase FemA/FemB family protein [Citricoccus sp. NR2]WBL17724.1 peptidoglycan bridge formation glycyltransferase FemA/FemB family protein [Citricoccus sp. NR2]